MTTRPPLAALARERHLAGDAAGARRALQDLVHDVTGTPAVEVTIRDDAYSLNSLNGTVELADGRRLFFKFHTEEDEKATITEYYNAELLDRHGYAVDVPVHASGEPGRQVLLYRLREDHRMADACRAVEAGDPLRTAAGRLLDADALVAAQVDRDQAVAERMIASLHPATVDQTAGEPVHQLFWHRLTGPGRAPGTGGRVERFYKGTTVRLGGGDPVTVAWERFADLRWVVNGQEYARTVREMFEGAGRLLDPSRASGTVSGAAGAVVAHGDDHNANVWVQDGPDHAVELVAFDPAFAGEHLPALLADVKATFHNVLAHPWWLYEPSEATARRRVRVRLDGDRLVVDHDHVPGPVRSAFLASKTHNVWRPLVGALAARDLLPSDWADVVRAALFCCPTLVMDLRAGGAGGHTPVSSAIGWAVAVAAGSPTADGSADAVGSLLAAAAPPA